MAESYEHSVEAGGRGTSELGTRRTWRGLGGELSRWTEAVIDSTREGNTQIVHQGPRAYLDRIFTDHAPELSCIVMSELMCTRRVAPQSFTTIPPDVFMRLPSYKA
jgi:hypothetical protein